MNQENRNELVRYRLTRANEVLLEINVLVANQFWNTAVNRCYYACYYAVTALLVDKGIAASTHSGVRLMSGLHFIKTGIFSKDHGKFYSEIFDLRQTGDYEDYIDYSESDAIDLLLPTEQLVTAIGKLLEEPLNLQPSNS
jgi:uncharacterized protein (UPF0332 family)